jgi:hypothetical protein
MHVEPSSNIIEWRLKSSHIIYVTAGVSVYIVEVFVLINLKMTIKLIIRAIQLKAASSIHTFHPLSPVIPE